MRIIDKICLSVVALYTGACAVDIEFMNSVLIQNGTLPAIGIILLAGVAVRVLLDLGVIKEDKEVKNV